MYNNRIKENEKKILELEINNQAINDLYIRRGDCYSSNTITIYIYKLLYICC